MHEMIPISCFPYHFFHGLDIYLVNVRFHLPLLSKIQSIVGLHSEPRDKQD